MDEEQGREEHIGPQVIAGQPCAYCNTNSLTLSESSVEVPYFGKVFVYSMTCSNCKFHKADVEAPENKGPVKYSIDVETKEDLSVRVIKSAEATVKIPHVGEIRPGIAAQGYISNVEGVLRRMKSQIEVLRDTSEEEEDRKKAKNLLKKLQRVMWGQEKLKLIIEDPSGNSAIISDKAVKGK